MTAGRVVVAELAGSVAGFGAVERIGAGPDAITMLCDLQILAHVEGPVSDASVCLPAPHPAVRALLAGGWQFDEFDLFMATEPALIDPRRVVPSPAQG